MADAELISKDLNKHIMTVHKRFHKAIAARLPAIQLESKERYFCTPSVIVAQLEDPERPLRNILQDMMIVPAPRTAQEISK